jgi:3-deoxy-manno-octulosonate cytidylyltransferase (CMP-KDO synthetase)
MKILGIIPARYASTRFPGKPLFVIDGKSMIRRVYEQSKRCSSLSELVIATDDERIYRHVLEFGGNAIMTSENHKSGTERCNEAADKLQTDNISYDVIINIQGDEPYINPEQISDLANCFENKSVAIATLVKRIQYTEQLNNPNVVKVIFDRNMKAICFSRSVLPYVRGKQENDWISSFPFFKHIGIYGYTRTILREITKLGESPIERAESLEQMRWIENGYSIHVRETEYESIAIDAPEDLLLITNKDK